MGARPTMREIGAAAEHAAPIAHAAAAAPAAMGDVVAAPPASVLDAEPMTPGQRGALFTAASRCGMDIDELRALTPAGSISALTRGQASALLDRLNGGTEWQRDRRERPRAPRRPKGVYAIRTAAQIRKIEAIRIELGWTQRELDAWLGARTFKDGRAMNLIDSTADGIEVIQLLLHVAGKARKARGELQDSPQRDERMPAVARSWRATGEAYCPS